ncbi:hypothetical protein [Chitinophaga qingshengii]|uniref:Uncharacterized protein n=1 Tax=Chitinophaga qingshengii TaxID=1569794 RepID=A0ABR7TI13_9BACT|nr:hypothetical protein [Chitinophaga qingshengii]MBC9930141.1 hypothetical protein [Chitinophaga qingshengii]
MTEARHIFLEIDTYRLLSSPTTDDPPAALVLENTRLFDQGSMALGTPIQSFSILVEKNQDIFFTILPHLLYTDHKLYFNALVVGPGKIVITPYLDPEERPVSFKVTVVEAPENQQLAFSLKAVLQYQQGTEVKTMNLTIDPVLRANQGHGED